MPELTSARLRLRQLGAEDIPALFRLFSDLRVMRYWSFTPLTDLAGAERYLAAMQSESARGDLLQWGIEPQGGAEIIGQVTLRHISRANERAEVGFALGGDHHGRGYAREAVGAVLDFAFGPMALYRVEADVDPRNAASLRLLESLGFRREGLLRSRWFVGGERCDSVMLGLHREEWGR